jgi:regulator of cell morphogenesis and NO signaling
MKIANNKTVAEIVSENVGADTIFGKYNIDFCCGGGLTLEAACKNGNVNIEHLKAEILSVKNIISSKAPNKNRTLSSLIKEVKSNYQTYLISEIETVLPLAKKVADVHGSSHKEVIEINTLFRSIGFVLDELISNTNNTLYPQIKMIESGTLTSNEQIEKFKCAVSSVEIAHKLIGDSFKEIAKLSNSYTIPEDACNSFKFLYQKLSEIEHQLHSYFHFEKHELIPIAFKVLNK